jgi:hypothetical protein
MTSEINLNNFEKYEKIVKSLYAANKKYFEKNKESITEKRKLKRDQRPPEVKEAILLKAKTNYNLKYDTDPEFRAKRQVQIKEYQRIRRANLKLANLEDENKKV